METPWRQVTQRSPSDVLRGSWQPASLASKRPGNASNFWSSPWPVQEVYRSRMCRYAWIRGPPSNSSKRIYSDSCSKIEIISMQEDARSICINWTKVLEQRIFIRSALFLKSNLLLGSQLTGGQGTSAETKPSTPGPNIKRRLAIVGYCNCQFVNCFICAVWGT